MAPSAISPSSSNGVATKSAQSENREELQNSAPARFHINNKAALIVALRSGSPVLTHINADTTWLVHLPYPEDVARPRGRSHFNVLLDPWLQGTQSDVASWFSTQEHIIPSSVQTIEKLNSLLCELEHESARDAKGKEVETVGEEETNVQSYIDVVVISHEFTDHCHEKTLRELPGNTPVFAPDKAFKLIRSWNHFDTVIEMPAFLGAESKDWRASLNREPLPPWIGIGRVVTPGNQLYYHSAIMVAFLSTNRNGLGQLKDAENDEAIIYSPHGINASDLSGVRESGIRTIALLHGLHDVRIWMTKQLNLGGLNGAAAARECRAKYWITTHDEIKKGSGFISPLLRRTKWSLAEIIKKEARKESSSNAGDPGFEFIELGSGDGVILA